MSKKKCSIIYGNGLGRAPVDDKLTKVENADDIEKEVEVTVINVAFFLVFNKIK